LPKIAKKDLVVFHGTTDRLVVDIVKTGLKPRSMDEPILGKDPEDKVNENEPTKEMLDWFITRTNTHIALVQKYAEILSVIPGYQELKIQVKDHDASKWEEPEKTPYIFITWNYYCKEHDIPFTPPKNLKLIMTTATLHHVKNNMHHPEFYDDNIQPINPEDRDKPSETIVDAYKMPDLSIAEMVADWLGMAEEKGTNAKDWAFSNIGKRWSFTKTQENLIYSLIEKGTTNATPS
jgi:hypothetical protein